MRMELPRSIMRMERPQLFMRTERPRLFMRMKRPRIVKYGDSPWHCRRSNAGARPTPSLLMPPALEIRQLHRRRIG